MATDTEPLWDIARATEVRPARLWWRGTLPTQRTWRAYAAVVISSVIQETTSTDVHVLRQRLRAAYPFGVRHYHPYKIWCDEVNRQLGLKQPAKRKSPLLDPVPPEQGRLFEFEEKET